MLEIRVVNSTPADTEPKSPGHSRSEASVKLTVGSRANGLAVFMAARGEGIWHYRHFQSAEIGYFIRLIGLILKRHVVLKTRAAAAHHRDAQRHRHRVLHGRCVERPEFLAGMFV